ncbi:MAG: hypothetical protein Q8M20_01850 [Rhodocyclaceae bacterium]|nr:hypothetical protein [Rhodocyclaceae bacterium]MDZ4216579.1 hypothetical protein [Rhodocyclaceae bacterium]
MSKHRFIIVVPVADRPRHIQACLDSLHELLRRYPYQHLIRVLIADDSADAANVAANREIAARYSTPDLQVIHFGPEEQWTLSEPLWESLPGVVGNKPCEAFGHKGQGVMRNIAYLKVAAMLQDEPDDVLIWSLDSDQEFCVKLADGRIDYAVDYFGGLDAIFSRTDALVLTGKVVGDPPVSPAVMTANFLADVEGFLQDMATRTTQAPCSHHGVTQRSGDAAYHDMADLFGFQPEARYAYPCPLTGPHTDADCFAHFAGRVNSFFYGEHPTRISCYEPAELFSTVQPARTVYAGNYVFKPAALKYFIPFASLRLRMSGPTLGRIVKAELGPRFVSANLPMLHKRTVESGGQSEFRPGIETQAETIDMSGEFERQFYGDVMLFTTERRLSCRPAGADFCNVLDETRAEMLDKYNTRQQAILQRLNAVESLLNDPARWWQDKPATEHFRYFCANVRRNFGADSSGHARINDPMRWQQWRSDLLAAIERYPAERAAWEKALCRH